jgi:2-polyprenyl-6-methoxyphenol hydroxylase-like FAD-dependent oxidoreductase
MPIRERQILIVGAGIAGLALARALHARGFRAEIAERETAWPTGGAGLYLPGNGVRAIAALGLGDALMARAVRLPQQRILDRRGHRLAEVDLERVWRDVAPCVGIRRADLHQILLEGAAGVPIHFATTVSAVTQTADNVVVRFSGGLTRPYDVLVGADGIRSSIRGIVFGDISPRGVGQTSWRFVVPDSCGVTTWTVMLGGRRTFLMMPVGGGGLYCYADLLGERSADDGESIRDRLRTLFQDFADPVPRVLAQLDRIESIHAAAIEELESYRPAEARVVLIGDAAHAMSPNMAQGASMAVEDALTLTDELSRDHSPVGALASFAKRRHGRVTWVRERTHKRDRIRALPAVVRTLALRGFGGAIYKADYRPLFDEP